MSANLAVTQEDGADPIEHWTLPEGRSYDSWTLDEDPLANDLLFNPTAVQRSFTYQPCNTMRFENDRMSVRIEARITDLGLKPVTAKFLREILTDASRIDWETDNLVIVTRYYPTYGENLRKCYELLQAACAAAEELAAAEGDFEQKPPLRAQHGARARRLRNKRGGRHSFPL